MVEKPLNIDYPEWEKIIINLTAFAKMQIKTYNWSDDVIPKGMTADDFVMDTILKFLENPKVYDSKKSSLTYYLKTWILRQLISNASKSKENTTKRSININDSDAGNNWESYLPIADNTIEDDIDREDRINKKGFIDEESILKEIENQLKTDKELEDIYFCLQLGYKRHESCNELSITLSEYTNRLKRLKRKFSKLIQEFQEIKN